MNGTRFSSPVVRMKKVIAGLLLNAAMWSIGASVTLAQTEGRPTIHVDSHEVVVPVFVVHKEIHREADPSGAGPSDEHDTEITDLSAKDFRVFEDGKEQQIQNVTLEPFGIWEVKDNVGYHIEHSCTPKGIWSTSDLAKAHLGSGKPFPIYLVSYVPPPSPEGSCHQIKVKVDRQPSTVYSRDEYCNTKNALYDPLGGTKLGKRIEDFAASDKNGTLTVSAQAGSLFGNSGANRVDVAVEFVASELKREWTGIRLDSTVAILGMVYDKSGTLAARFSDLACSASEFGEIYNGPIPPSRMFYRQWELFGIPSRYETQFDLSPGDYDLKLAVSDGKRFRWVETPLKVDGFNRNSVAISGLVLCKRLRKAVDKPRGATQAPQYVPLVSNGLEYTPAGDTRFKRGELLLSYFEIYEPLLGGTGAVNVHFQMRVTDAKTGERKMESGLLSAEEGVKPGNSVIPVAERIAIEKLPTGTYWLEVQASDSAGNKSGWRTTFFTIE